RQGIEKHLLVVPHQVDDPTVRLEFEQQVDAAASAWPAVDDIPQRDQSVARLQVDLLQQGLERDIASVDVTNGNRSSRSHSDSTMPFPRRSRVLPSTKATRAKS